ncbi:MAG: DUF4190 domain-containing protein [Ruminococcus sp.]|nr:DUF4190 domain-containing protein [Ruminococcus sp.]
MEQQGKKGFAIASLVLGIVGCVIPWYGVVYGIIGIVCAVVGLVFAIMAKKSYNAIGQKNGMATAGMILSIVGIVLSVIGLIVCGVCVCVAQQALAESGYTVDDLNNALNELSQYQ